MCCAGRGEMMMISPQDVLEFLLRYLVDYVDIDVTLWISWALMPLMVTFLLPLVILLLLYTSAVILYIYKYKEPLQNAYELDFWDGARKTIAALWDAHGWVWHGYDVEGLENFPEDEPFLIVYYHGALPIDLYYFIARVYLVRNKLIHTVADKFLFKFPGWSIISEAMKVIPGTVQSCSAILQGGNSLAVSPGGVYEAQFSDHNYKLMWNKRLGFAKVALDAKVRVVPMFTVNVREAFRQVTTFRKFWLWVYTKTRFPFVPIYGGFPVKLRTVLGPPISIELAEGSPEKLSQLAAKGIEELIEKHQKLPGSILRGVIERIHLAPKSKTQ